MKDSVKGYILIVVAIAAGVGGYVLYSGTTDFQGYWWICAAVGVVALGFGLKFVFDNSSPSRAYESNIRNILNTFDSILVQSNAVPKLEGRNIVYTNTVTLEGIDTLKDKITELFKLEEIKKQDYNYITNVRQISKIKECLKRIDDIKESLNNEVPLDMIEIDLRDIWDILGEIIGESYTEELLDELFSKFCVGK